MELEGLNVDEVCSLLESKGFEPDFVSIFLKQKVAGCILVDLDDAEMEDIGIEPWGDRRLCELISSGVAKQSPTVTPRRYEVVGYAKQANHNLYSTENTYCTATCVWFYLFTAKQSLLYAA